MGESHHQAASSSRLGMRNTGGEIVEVQGGHIVRSTGRKDRHSKVCTAKGPRDRRVRLSAHTAIQFYDVQDRLGYDRPSKAVDWLIKKAKPAIDELAELPAWNPTTISATTTTTSKTARRSSSGTHQQQQQDILMGDGNSRDYQFSMDNHLTASAAVAATGSGSTSRTTVTIAAAGVGTSTRGGGTGILGTNNNVQNAMTAENHNPSNSSSFLPPTLDSDAIADTIKSFFPIGVPAETSSSIQFQNYPPDLLSRTSSQNQDLRLSLQSFQEPILLQQHHHQSHHHHGHNEHGQQQVLFSGHLGFDGGSYHPADHINRFQRMVALTAVTSGAADHTGGGGSGGGESGSGGGGFIFNALPPTMSSSPLLPLLQPLFGGSGGCEFSSQRGPLQSSNMPSVRAWTDPAAAIITAADHQIPQIHQQQPQQHSAIIPGIGFVAPAGCSGGGFSGFRIPARIRGEEEEHDGIIPDKPSSASSDSRH